MRHTALYILTVFLAAALRCIKLLINGTNNVGDGNLHSRTR